MCQARATNCYIMLVSSKVFITSFECLFVRASRTYFFYVANLVIPPLQILLISHHNSYICNRRRILVLTSKNSKNIAVEYLLTINGHFNVMKDNLLQKIQFVDIVVITIQPNQFNEHQ